MMSMDDHASIGVKTLGVDNGYSLEKEVTKLLHKNP